MKTIKKENGKEEPNFPCLMVNPKTGTVILATEKNDVNITGMVVYEEKPCRHCAGRYGTSFSGDLFTPYTGTVTLSND